MYYFSQIRNMHLLHIVHVYLCEYDINMQDCYFTRSPNVTYEGPNLIQSARLKSRWHLDVAF